MKNPLLIGLLLLGTTTSVQAQTNPVTLNFYSGGDVNVKDLWENNLLPMYQKTHPNVRINLVFSSHGDNDQATIDRMAAAKKAGKPSGIDLLEGPVDDAGTAGLMDKLSVQKVPLLARVSPAVVNRAHSYGVPYRASSVVLAYDSSRVKNPPKTVAALLDWINKNPGQFTYNTPDTGGSGNAFVTRILMGNLTPADASFFQTDYDAAREKAWSKGLSTLKTLAPKLYQNGQYSQNNVGTLQLLGKGAIQMGPVWSDMGLSYLKQGLLPDNIKLTQIDPPLAGGAAYLGVAADSVNKAAAYDFLNWLLTPEVQSVVVDKMNGYPGVKLQYMPKDVQTRFGDIAGDFSYGFSSKFGSDMNRLWYEQVAGTAQPQH
ncbi:extracellular solute-binding protein [Deinococcus ruber]|uniref:ABC transporter substrate-binding protein n=1 Tax=Deinococcus ruber TaxID=1848197 RepID=A0A918F8L8_9DEIO|nr:extracellular solute-binding protein [Deinococcus ruber]GGR10731.1 ABC transporter substrate-binding protein [Deinococcus ruber]